MPAIAFATDLILSYPSGKIILTNRDLDSWHASVSRTVLQSRLYWLHGALQYLDWATGLVHPMRVKLWQCMFDDNFQKNGKNAMKMHYEEVRACAKMQGREILEMQLGDGWHELCGFLKISVPEGPYPRENDSNGFIPKMKERARLRMRAVALRWLKVTSIIATVGFIARFVIAGLSGRNGRLFLFLRKLARHHQRSR